MVINKINKLTADEVIELLKDEVITIEDLENTKFHGDEHFVLKLFEDKIIEENDLYNTKYKIGNNIYFSSEDSYSNYKILDIDINSCNGNNYEIGFIEDAYEDAYQNYFEETSEHYETRTFEEWYSDLQCEYTRHKNTIRSKEDEYVRDMAGNLRKLDKDGYFLPIEEEEL